MGVGEGSGNGSVERSWVEGDQQWEGLLERGWARHLNSSRKTDFDQFLPQSNLCPQMKSHGNFLNCVHQTWEGEEARKARWKNVFCHVEVKEEVLMEDPQNTNDGAVLLRSTEKQIVCFLDVHLKCILEMTIHLKDHVFVHGMKVEMKSGFV